MSDGYFVGVADTGSTSYVYVGCPDRAEFDKIRAEARDSGRKENGNHVITKSVTQGAVTVIFQHWIEHEPIDAMVKRLTPTSAPSSTSQERP